jgi:hypothetical protein
MPIPAYGRTLLHALNNGATVVNPMIRMIAFFDTFMKRPPVSSRSRYLLNAEYSARRIGYHGDRS